MSEALKGALIIGQSGGPSSVINSSAYGCIRTALDADCITKVYGAYHGIKGVLNDELLCMDEEDRAELDRLPYTPSSALGSCRYKIKDPDEDDTDYKRILEIFKKYNVRYFCYNGGNDSMDTCNKISKYMKKVGYECRVMGIPKTIDNDLFGTDHCPGYASAAKYIATSVMEVSRDAHVYDTGMITIIECMGRHAGWLTAAAALANEEEPCCDFIYLPEVNFDMDKFVADVSKRYEEKKNCIVAVSEGVHYADGSFVSEAKTAATLTGKASRGRMLIEDKSVRVPLTVLCGLAAGFVILMYICVPIGSFFPTWGYKFFPLTGKWFKLVFTRYHGFQAFRDSFVLSLIAAPITALLSMIISYLVVKRRFKAKGFIEAVSMLAMAVPGTVLGVGYIRGFASGVFHTGFLQGIYGTGLILIIVFVVRSLPTGTRSGISALRQIDKSIEESAYDMGADSFKVFMTVTLPLIKDSFLSGLVTAFVRSITAISAIILLVTPQFLLITVQINEFAEKGSYSLACAFATILIIITYGAVLLMNLFIKHFGTSKKLKEVD